MSPQSQTLVIANANESEPSMGSLCSPDLLPHSGSTGRKRTRQPRTPANQSSPKQKLRAGLDFDTLVIDTSRQVCGRRLAIYSEATNAEVEARSTMSLDVPRRPMNAFMVWAQIVRRELHSRYSNVQNASLSKALGRVWRSMDFQAKEPFVQRANTLKANHKRDYPNYRYQPRRLQDTTIKGNIVVGFSVVQQSQTSYLPVQQAPTSSPYHTTTTTVQDGQSCNDQNCCRTSLIEHASPARTTTMQIWSQRQLNNNYNHQPSSRAIIKQEANCVNGSAINYFHHQQPDNNSWHHQQQQQQQQQNQHHQDSQQLQPQLGIDTQPQPQHQRQHQFQVIDGPSYTYCHSQNNNGDEPDRIMTTTTTAIASGYHEQPRFNEVYAIYENS